MEDQIPTAATDRQSVWAATRWSQMSSHIKPRRMNVKDESCTVHVTADSFQSEFQIISNLPGSFLTSVVLNTAFLKSLEKSAQRTGEIYFFMDVVLYTDKLSCWNKKGFSLNCCHKVGSTSLFKISSQAVVFTFSLVGTKRPRPNQRYAKICG